MLPFGRTIETTLIAPRVAASFLFCPREISPQTSPTYICENLGITEFRSFAAHDLQQRGVLQISAGAILLVPEFPLLTDQIEEAGRNLDHAGMVSGLAHIGEMFLQDRINQELFETPLIAIENSPLHLQDFVTILKSGSGAAIGAYVGYAAGQANPPLLLVTVPCGILICASAIGLANALESGLRARLHRWLLDSETRT